MSKKPKPEVWVFQFFTYDLWGNSRDGWQVNDVYPQGLVYLSAKPQKFGDKWQLTLTDLQINRALGCRGVEWGGEADYTLYGEVKHNGKPVAELRRVRKEE